MYRTFGKKMETISNAKVDVYMASEASEYWWPFRLQHIGRCRKSVREESLKYIVDSDFNNPDATNEEVLEKAIQYNATTVIPKDIFHDQEATTENIHEFVDLHRDSMCAADVMVPLQPPFDKHYPELSRCGSYALGGIQPLDADEQIEAVERFFDVADPTVNRVHVLGARFSPEWAYWIRKHPHHINSLDLSTPEQEALTNAVRGEELMDGPRTKVPFPKGDNSAVIRMCAAEMMGLEFCHILSDNYDMEYLEEAQANDPMDW